MPVLGVQNIAQFNSLWSYLSPLHNLLAVCLHLLLHHAGATLEGLGLFEAHLLVELAGPRPPAETPVQLKQQHMDTPPLEAATRSRTASMLSAPSVPRRPYNSAAFRSRASQYEPGPKLLMLQTSRPLVRVHI